MRPVAILAAVGLFIWLGVGGIAALARTTLSQGRTFGTPELVSMSFVDPRTGWAVATDCSSQSASSASSACESEMYATTDGGQSWTATSRVLLTTKSLTFAEVRSGWLIGSIGQRCGSNLCQNVIMLSEDGGKKWTRVSTVSAELTDVSAVSKYDVWAVGRVCPPGRACTGALVHTTSGGQLWDSLDLPIVGSDLRTGRVTPLVGWVTSPSALAGQEPLALTHDGGATWTVPSTPCRGAGALADFSSERDGWLVCSNDQNEGASLTVSRSTDGGTTWKTFGSIATNAQPSAPSLPTASIADAGRGPSGPLVLARSIQVSPMGGAWVALATGQLLHVSSRGDHTSGPSTDEALKQVLFVDSQHGWLLGSRSMWSTVDGGQSWIKSVVVAGLVR